jgi:hypothetical protein
MSNTIRIKKRAASGSAGAPSSLSPSELAFNENDLKLYYGFGDDGSTPPAASSIITIGGAGAFFNKTDTRSANAILAGPTSGSAAAPTFRSLVAADIPSIAHTKISDFDTGVRTNRLNEMTAPNGEVSFASQKITNLADPTSDNDAANKGYVDGVAQGLDIKDSCTAATTANITISTALNNGDTIDGVTLSTNDRVLVKNQNTASENGIYKVGSSPARVDDLAAGADAAGAFTFVEQGTVNGDNAFVCSSDKGSAVVGTNNLTFVQFSGAGQVIAGNGLDKSGNTLSVDLKSGGGLTIESTELAVNLSAGSITGTLQVGDGGTGATSASGARTNLGLVIGTDVEPHSDKLTELATMNQNTAQSLADLTSSEVQILDGATVTTAQLNRLDATSSVQTQLDAKQPLDAELTELATMSSGTASALADLTGTEVGILDGATLTTTELNFVDGVTSAIQTQLDAKQASDAQLTELATMASGTADALADLTGTEVQILDGATVSTTELNKLDGLTATTTELNLLDGVTSTTAELNFTDGVTSNIQTQLNNKQPLDSELTELATMASGTASALADLTGTEVAILDGATVTTTELNIMDGGTSATSTTLATADRMVMNDNGTMKQVALSDLVTFLEDGSTSGFDIDGGTY